MSLAAASGSTDHKGAFIMEIRKATAADLDGVEAIYNAVLDHQAATVN